MWKETAENDRRGESKLDVRIKLEIGKNRREAKAKKERKNLLKEFNKRAFRKDKKQYYNIFKDTEDGNKCGGKRKTF